MFLYKHITTTTTTENKASLNITFKLRVRGKLEPLQKCDKATRCHYCCMQVPIHRLMKPLCSLILQLWSMTISIFSGSNGFSTFDFIAYVAKKEMCFIINFKALKSIHCTMYIP